VSLKSPFGRALSDLSIHVQESPVSMDKHKLIETENVPTKNLDPKLLSPSKDISNKHITHDTASIGSCSSLNFESFLAKHDSVTKPTFMLQTLLDKEVLTHREKRKRKRETRLQNRKLNTTPSVSAESLHKTNANSTADAGKTEKENTSDGNHIEYERPVSTWTSASKKSLGSNDSLLSFDVDKYDREHKTRGQRFHENDGPTALEFRSLHNDVEDEIVDIEESGNQDSDDDTWLDTKSRQNKHDPFYGVKPYRVVDSGSFYDSDVRTQIPFNDKVNTTTDEIIMNRTRQKLIQSRKFGRPVSETVMSTLTANRPPLPPGRDVKARPQSETQRKTHTFSRYFASDLDVR